MRNKILLRLAGSMSVATVAVSGIVPSIKSFNQEEVVLEKEINVLSIMSLNKHEINLLGNKVVAQELRNGKKVIYNENFRLVVDGSQGRLEYGDKVYSIYINLNHIKRGFFSWFASAFKAVTTTITSPISSLAALITDGPEAAREVFTKDVAGGWREFGEETSHQFSNWKSWIPGLELGEALADVLHGTGFDNKSYSKKINKLTELLMEDFDFKTTDFDNSTKWSRVARGHFTIFNKEVVQGIIINTLLENLKGGSIREITSSLLDEISDEINSDKFTREFTGDTIDTTVDIISKMIDRKIEKMKGRTAKIIFTGLKYWILDYLGKSLVSQAIKSDETNPAILLKIARTALGTTVKITIKESIIKNVEKQLNQLIKKYLMEAVEKRTFNAFLKDFEKSSGVLSIISSVLDLTSDLSIYNEILIGERTIHHGQDGAWVKVKVFKRPNLIGSVYQNIVQEIPFFLTTEKLNKFLI